MHLEFVYVRVHNKVSDHMVEIARTARQPSVAGQARQIGQALAPWLKSINTGSPSVIAHPIGEGNVHALLVPLGWQGKDDGALVAGSLNSNFPTEADRLLLNVGANQAAMMIQRQRAEQSARVANVRLDLAVRGSNIGIWEVDMPDGDYRTGHYDFANIWERLAYDPACFPTDLPTSMALIPSEDQQHIEQVLDSYLATETAKLEFEHRIRHHDGSYRWMLVRGVATRDDTGKPVRLIGSSVDITELKRAENAARVSEERLAADLAGMSRLQEVSTRLVQAGDSHSLLHEIVDAAIAVTSADMGMVQLLERDSYTLKIVASRGFERPFLDFFDTMRDHECACGAAMKRGERKIVEDVATSPIFANTPARDVVLAAGIRAVQSTPLIGRLGQLVGVLSTQYRERRFPEDRDLHVLDLLARQAADWIERRRSEEALRDSEERFRGTFENAAVGIGHLGPDCRYLRVNQKLCEILGYDRSELLGVACLEITSPDDIGIGTEHFAALMRGELASFSIEKRYLSKVGSPIWVHVSVSLQRDSAGNPDYAIEMIEDVSGRKRLEKELLQAKDAAESANRAKDEFLANVSHEIRTPMNAILGMTDLALETPLTNDQRACLGTARSAAENLLVIINDLLDFSKIEAGKMDLKLSNFALRAMLDETLRALAAHAHAKGLDLVCHVRPDVLDTLKGDSVRLRQVLTNLVGNAIKFTDEGEVEIAVTVEEALEPNELRLCFAVRDTGIGIPADQQQRIFEAFEQEDTSTTRNFGGTGLGLTISSRLVALMGGRILVESAPGLGSRFSFTARFDRQQPADDSQRHSSQVTPTLPSLRILVAEDNEFNARHLERLLVRYGHQVRMVSNGREALAMLGISRGSRDHDGGQLLFPESATEPVAVRYDVLLLDVHMPELDGFEVARTIRAWERTAGGHLPVIALTAHSRKKDRERCLAVGMDEYLAKPARAAELLAAIDYVRRTQAVRIHATSLLAASVLLAACGEDAQALRELCADFRDFAPARLAEADEALQKGDIPRLREEAHKLQGLLGAFSLIASQVAFELEDHAAFGRFETARDCMARLKGMSSQLQSDLEQVSVESLRERS